MKIVGCDLQARQQSLALLDRETGELIERTLVHEANQVEEFYSSLRGPVLADVPEPSACALMIITGLLSWRKRVLTVPRGNLPLFRLPWRQMRR